MRTNSTTQPTLTRRFVNALAATRRQLPAAIGALAVGLCTLGAAHSVQAQTYLGSGGGGGVTNRFIANETTGLPFTYVSESSVANNTLDPGETVTLQFTVANIGTNASTNKIFLDLQHSTGNINYFATNGVLSAGSAWQFFTGDKRVGIEAPIPLTVQSPTTNETIPVGGTASYQLTFRVNGGFGVTTNLQWRIRGTNNNNSATYDTLLEIGQRTTNFYRFPGGPISIVDFTTNSGMANPYPSSNLIACSTIPNDSGATGERVSGVKVTISNLTHTFTRDIRALLVGPQGQAVRLMNGAGVGFGTANATLVFDASASSLVPFGSAIPSNATNTYRPSDYATNDTNVLGGGLTNLPSSYATNLTVFGTADRDQSYPNPNGTWKLYVQDSALGDYGSISGWSLEISTIKFSPAVTGGTPPIFASTNQVSIGDQEILGNSGSGQRYNYTNDLGGGFTNYIRYSNRFEDRIRISAPAKLPTVVTNSEDAPATIEFTFYDLETPVPSFILNTNVGPAVYAISSDQSVIANSGISIVRNTNITYRQRITEVNLTFNSSGQVSGFTNVNTNTWGTFSLSGTNNANGNNYLTSVSSNTANIFTATNYSITYTPVTNAYGTTLLTLIAIDGDGNVSSNIISVTLTNANDPPVILPSPLFSQTAAPGQDITMSLTIFDFETTNANLLTRYVIVPTNASGTNWLIPGTGTSGTFSNSGTNFTLTLTPTNTANSGTNSTTITIVVSDGEFSTMTNVVLNWNGTVGTPTISLSQSSVTTTEDTAATGTVIVLTSGTTTQAGSLNVTGSSTNGAIANSGISITANTNSGAVAGSRLLTITPVANAVGTNLPVTITATDPLNSSNTTATVLVTITPVNDAPTITSVANQTINQNAATGLLTFTVGDAADSNSPTSLIVTYASGDTSIVPNNVVTNDVMGADFPTTNATAGIFVSSTSSNTNGVITLNVRPTSNTFGKSTITITVSDGTTNTSTSFSVFVNQINQPPAFTTITSTNQLGLTPLTNTTIATNLFAATNAPVVAIIKEDDGNNNNGNQGVFVLINGLSAGAASELDQTVVVSAVSENTNVVRITETNQVTNGTARLFVRTIATNELTTNATILVTITDTASSPLSIDRRIGIGIVATNDNPTMTALPTRQTRTDQPVTVTVAATDRETSSGQFTLTIPTPGTNFFTVATNSAQNRFVITPNTTNQFSSNIVVTVSDRGELNAGSAIAITITNNMISEGETLTINGVARMWTNAAASATTITLNTNSVQAQWTNLYNALTAFPVSGAISVSQSSTNVITLTMLNNIGATGLSVSRATNWGTLATNGTFAIVTNTFLLTVTNQVPPTISLNTNTVSMVQDSAASVTVSISGGSGPYTFGIFIPATQTNLIAIADVVVPAGVTNSGGSTNTVQIVPETGAFTYQTGGTSNSPVAITFTVTDALGVSASQTLSVAILDTPDYPVVVLSAATFTNSSQAFVIGWEDVSSNVTGARINFTATDAEDAASSLAIAISITHSNGVALSPPINVTETRYTLGYQTNETATNLGLRTLTFVAPSNEPSTNTIQIAVTDSTSRSTTVLFTNHVVALNDAPRMSVAYTNTSGTFVTNNATTGGATVNLTVLEDFAPMTFYITNLYAGPTNAYDEIATQVISNVIRLQSFAGLTTTNDISTNVYITAVTTNGTTVLYTNRLNGVTNMIGTNTVNGTVPFVIQPVTNGYGAARIVLTAMDTGTNSSAGPISTNGPVQLTINLTITQVNDAPTITGPTNLTVGLNSSNNIVSLVITDPETDAFSNDPTNRLSLTASSDNQSLVPASGLSFGGSGSNRSLEITPIYGAEGSNYITIVVSDPQGLRGTNIIALMVGGGATNPVISGFASSYVVAPGTTINTAQAVSFTVSDPDNVGATFNNSINSTNTYDYISSNSLPNTLVFLSSNPNVVPQTSGSMQIVGSGTNVNRQVYFIPKNPDGEIGSTTIRVVATDSQTNRVTAQFTVTVGNRPTISAITNQTMSLNSSGIDVAFTVTDDITVPGAIGVTGSSSNTTLIPTVQIIVTNTSGGNRVARLVPATNQAGSSVITLTATDIEGLTATASFTVTVANQTPTISAIAALSIGQSSTSSAMPFTVGDAETPTNLTVTSTSSATNVIAASGIAVSLTGTSGTVTITSGTVTGTSTVRIIVTDPAGASSSNSFVVTVAPNTSPTITGLPSTLSLTKNTASSAIGFTVSDAESAASTLTTSVTTANSALITTSGLVISGSGGVRTLTVTPVTNAVGTTTVSVIVTDQGGASRTNAITVTIVAPVPTKGDFNGNGVTDILFEDPSGFLAVWYMGGTNGTTLQSASYLVPSAIDSASWKIAATGDFNRDGNEDIVFQHTDGSIKFWYMNGIVQLQEVLPPVNNTQPGWRLVASGDLDGDGKPDLIWQLLVGGDSYVAAWLLDGLAIKGTPSYFTPANTGDFRWRVAASGDVNGDGKLDLIFEHASGSVAAWYLGGANGTTLSSAVGLAATGDTAWHLRGAAGAAGAQRLIFEHDLYYLAYWQFSGNTRTGFGFTSPNSSGGPWRAMTPR